MLDREQGKLIVLVLVMLGSLALFDFGVGYSEHMITGAQVYDGSGIGAYIHDFHIGNGWSMVGVESLQNSRVSYPTFSCDRKKFADTVWAYESRANDFVKKRLNSNFTVGDAIDEKSRAIENRFPHLGGQAESAVWIYNSGDECILPTRLTKHTSQFRLLDNWALINVQKAFVGREFSDFFEQSNVSKTSSLEVGKSEGIVLDMGSDGFATYHVRASGLSQDAQTGVKAQFEVNGETTSFISPREKHDLADGSSLIEFINYNNDRGVIYKIVKFEQCEFTTGYLYNQVGGQWDIFTGSHTFTDDELGKGFYTLSKNCNIDPTN